MNIVVNMLDMCVSLNWFDVCVPQADVFHLPATSLPVECVPAGAYAAGEMETEFAHNYR